MSFYLGLRALRSASLAIVAGLFWGTPTIAQAQSDSIYVATGDILFEEDGQKRRLIIQPGTPLKYIRSETDATTTKTRLVVQTPTGVVGSMPADKVEILGRSSDYLAIVKKELTQGGITFKPGDLHPFERVDDDEEMKFALKTGTAKYVVKEGEFILIPRTRKISTQKFVKHMEIVTFDKIVGSKFMEWKRIKSGGTPVSQAWGCVESSKVVDYLAASAVGELSAGASFWGWLEAKLSVKAEAGSDRSWTIDKIDKDNKHTISFWTLNDADGKPKLSLVMDRMTPCPGKTGKTNYAYSFPAEELDDFQISHSWVEESGASRYPGITVPLTLISLDDLRTLDAALESSRYLRGTNFFKHIRDLIVQYNAYVSPPASASLTAQE